MRCSRVQEILDDHVDGLLPSDDAERVRSHLDGCTDCRESALAARAASTSLATWGDHEPPPCCFDQILAKIDSLPPQALHRPVSRRAAPFSRRSLRWAAPALATAAAVVVAFVVHDGRRRTTPAALRTGPAVVAASSLSAPSSVRGASSLRPGEEFVHIDRSAWDPAIRRIPGGFVPPTLPATFDEGAFFAAPR